MGGVEKLPRECWSARLRSAIAPRGRASPRGRVRVNWGQEGDLPAALAPIGCRKEIAQNNERAGRRYPREVRGPRFQEG
jgi:hypothetical protein